MKCYRCEVCGKTISDDNNSGSKLCIPVIVGTSGGNSSHCWCVCDDCRDDFLERSAKVLQKPETKSLQ